MSEAYIVDAVRTPRGKRNGYYDQMHAIDLAAQPLQALVARNQINPVEIDDVIYGCVSQRGEQDSDIARAAILASNWPVTVPGVSLNRFCASGLTACNFAAQAIMSGQSDLLIGGGVEHMSHVAMEIDFYHGESGLSEHYPNLVSQGISAEMIAEKYQLSRQDLDEYATRSQQRVAIAMAENRFKNSIIPISVETEAGNKVVQIDEYPRPETSVKGLGKLKTAFKADGVITAGNASGIVDGAAGVLIASKRQCEALQLTPRAKFVSMAAVGSDPLMMLLGPVPATQKALQRAGLTIDDIDVFEINEAFASVVLAVCADLRIPLEKVNVNGGAIAMGHPLGATGAILLGTCLDELERQNKRFGLVSLCIGFGMGVTTIIDRQV